MNKKNNLKNIYKIAISFSTMIFSINLINRVIVNAVTVDYRPAQMLTSLNGVAQHAYNEQELDLKSKQALQDKINAQRREEQNAIDRQNQIWSQVDGVASIEAQNMVLEKLQSSTGVSKEQWNQIIYRESKWNIGISNFSGSGAYGLFQMLPFHWNFLGHKPNLLEQVNIAINLYYRAGLAPWALTV
ncbi:MAG: hypothetical protein LBC17_03505 [Lactobacillaceae bacterium]|jgi:hypothetical protein|nr:hypothetical protein [Lactobacillaceae bacterium]